ncbi:MAG: cell division protein FtsL [Nitrospira sp.]|nr:cell division protein FtsL [Nitrospira sp.]
MKTVAFAVVMVLLLLYVWERVDIVRVGYQVERLKSKKVALQRESDELRVKVSALTAPERIAHAAADKLGMMPPGQGQIVLVRVETTLPTNAGPAMPELRLAKNEVGGRMP